MSTAVIVWLAAAIVFIIAEAATVSLVSIWFIGGAVCALVAASLGADTAVQLALFVGVSALLLAFVCPAVRRRFGRTPEKMNADALAGQLAIVTEPIDAAANTGAVRINGVLWTAKCPDCPRLEPGAHVIVERVEGAKLYVKPAQVPCADR